MQFSPQAPNIDVDNLLFYVYHSQLIAVFNESATKVEQCDWLHRERDRDSDVSEEADLERWRVTGAGESIGIRDQ